MPNVPDPTPTCPECGERMRRRDVHPMGYGEPTVLFACDPCNVVEPVIAALARTIPTPPEKCRDKAARLIDPLRQAARALGYSLAVHGSLARDIDLIACPWTDEAADAETLAEAIRAKAAELVGIAFLPTRTAREFPRRKPHGRLCWLFHLGDGSTYIDLSVMPRDPLAVAVAETYPTPLAWSVDWDRVENVETFMTEGSAYRIGERGGHWFFEVLGSGNGFMPTRDEAVNMARLFCKAAETKGTT